MDRGAKHHRDGVIFKTQNENLRLKPIIGIPWNRWIKFQPLLTFPSLPNPNNWYDDGVEVTLRIGRLKWNLWTMTARGEKLYWIHIFPVSISRFVTYDGDKTTFNISNIYVNCFAQVQLKVCTSTYRNNVKTTWRMETMEKYSTSPYTLPLCFAPSSYP